MTRTTCFLLRSILVATIKEKYKQNNKIFDRTNYINISGT